MEASTHKYGMDLIALCCFCISIFLFLALQSFSPLDSSYFSVSIPEVPISNSAGKIGAFVSSVLMYFFGVASYAIPISLVVSAIIFIKYRRDSNIILTQSIGAFLFILTFMWAVSKLIVDVNYDNFILPSAGVVGEFFFTRFDTYLGPKGSVIFLVGIGIASFIIMLKLSLVSMVIKSFNFLLKKTTLLPGFILKKIKTIFLKKESVELNDQIHLLNTETEKIETSLLQELSSDIDTPKQQELDLKEPKIKLRSYNNRSPKSYDDYNYPDTSILVKTVKQDSLKQKEDFKKIADNLKQTFEDFGIFGSIIAIHPGPVVTVYEFQPDAGTKLSKITSLVDDIALALKVDSIFIHPVKGKCAVGIQVPNTIREMVTLGDVIESKEFKQNPSPLSFVLGKSILGDPICADLTTMPHLLLAGSTGSGKSVAINSLICSIITKSSPEKVRMILVDPKMLELSVYEGLPHLLTPVITEPSQANSSLKWAVFEMERRYKLMQATQVRNIEAYNSFIDSMSEEQTIKLKKKIYELTHIPSSSILDNEDEKDEDTKYNDIKIEKLPFILIVIDELADLMLTACKEVESSIQRLAQKARASGIHLVLATQRPSVDVITGVIKANLPYRISFQVVSRHDSRTIIDQMGADKLLGKGDMLFLKPGANRLERIQGAFISDSEVIKYVEGIKVHESECEYNDEIIEWMKKDELDRSQEKDLLKEEFDDVKIDEAIEIGKTYGSISSSFLQRQLKIGYNRAARIVEYLEAQGMVEKSDGAKPRKWIGG